MFLAAAVQVRPIPCVLGVHLEPVVQSAELKVLTREADESSVESKLVLRSAQVHHAFF